MPNVNVADVVIEVEMGGARRTFIVAADRIEFSSLGGYRDLTTVNLRGYVMKEIETVTPPVKERSAVKGVRKIELE